MFKNLAKLVRGRDIQVRAVVITALASYALQLSGILLRWPLWMIALGTILPWIPLFTTKVLWSSRHYGFMAFYAVLMLVQAGHVGEHLFQMGEYIFYKETPYQGQIRAVDTFGLDDPRLVRVKVTDAYPTEGNLFILKLPQPLTNVNHGQITTTKVGGVEHTGQYVNFATPDGRGVAGIAVVFPNCLGWSWNGASCSSAHGVFGELDRELVHFAWDGAILLACLILFLKFRDNPWTFWALLAAAVHQIEHVYLFGSSLDIASGYPGKGAWLGLAAQQVDAGLLARNGVIGTLTGLDGFLNNILPNRINIHFIYNLLVFIPMVGAFLYQVGRIYDEWLAKALPMLSRADLIRFSQNATTETFAPGQLVFEQGAAADKFYIITKGQVEICRSDKRGNAKALATLGPGAYFGEIGILGRTRRTASVKALTLVETLGLDEATFRTMVVASGENHKEVDVLVRQRIKQLAASAGKPVIEQKVENVDEDSMLKSRILRGWLDDMEYKSQLLNWNGLAEPVGNTGKLEVTPTFANQITAILPVSAGKIGSGVAVAAPPALGTLRVRLGPNAGEKYEINAARIIIGRRSSKHASSPTPVFMLDDNRVSRDHVEISQQPDGIYIRDMSSSNGSWLNSKQLENYPVRFQDGDELRLGTDTVITYSQL